MAKAEETRAPDAAAGQREARETAKEARSQERGKQAEQPAESRPQETGMVRHRHGSPARSDGWGPIARLRDEFDRLFDQFSRGWLGMPAAPAGRGGWGLDVREDDDAVTVRAEAPGFEPGDFDIQVRGDQLVMCACRRAEEEDEGYRGWRRSEFYESVALPADVDPEKVKANYRHGVLTVTLPKTEAGKARRIAVEG